MPYVPTVPYDLHVIALQMSWFILFDKLAGTDVNMAAQHWTQVSCYNSAFSAIFTMQSKLFLASNLLICLIRVHLRNELLARFIMLAHNGVIGSFSLGH